VEAATASATNAAAAEEAEAKRHRATSAAGSRQPVAAQAAAHGTGDVGPGQEVGDRAAKVVGDLKAVHAATEVEDHPVEVVGRASADHAAPGAIGDPPQRIDLRLQEVQNLKAVERLLNLQHVTAVVRRPPTRRLLLQSNDMNTRPPKPTRKNSQPQLRPPRKRSSLGQLCRQLRHSCQGR